MSLPFPFQRYRAELEAELKSVVTLASPELCRVLSYHLGWVDKHGHREQTSGGRLLRPTLCLLACEAVGGDWHKAVPAAAAVELLHNFSLIHDDIEDKSHQRHHRPTVWKVWGQAQGINAGDAMLTLSQLAILRLKERGIPPDKVALVSHLLNRACLGLCEGQYLDIEFETRPEIGLNHYLEMIDRKTAQLFECSLHLGALLGTDNQQQISSLSSFGRKLGMAYQIQDDLLGIWETEETTGKSLYTDIKRKKKTPPIIYALKKVKGEQRERLREIYQHERISAEDIALVLQILDQLGARSYTQRFKKQYQLQTLKELKAAVLPPSAQRELEEMTAFMLAQD